MRVLVVTNMWPSPDAPGRGIFVEEQVRSLEARGVEVEVLAVDTRGRRRRYLGLPAAVAAREIRRRPDVVHVHYGLTGAPVVLVRLAPVVVTFHGSDVFIPWQRRISRIAAHGASARIFQSASLRDRLGVDGEIVPCGVDPQRFRPLDRDEARRRLGLDRARPMVLFGGSRDAPVKDYDLLAAAASRLSAPPEIHELRGIDRDEVPWWMAAADVLAVTSRYEGGPLVVKEALFCGLPVVSVPVGDVPEVLSGVPGCAVVGRSAEGVAKGLAGVLGRPARLGQIPALERYTLDAVAERLEALYARVARAGRR